MSTSQSASEASARNVYLLQRDNLRLALALEGLANWVIERFGPESAEAKRAETAKKALGAKEPYAIHDGLILALKPMLAARTAYSEAFRSFEVVGDTAAERAHSEGEQRETAEEAAFDVLAQVTFPELVAAEKAVQRALALPELRGGE